MPSFSKSYIETLTIHPSIAWALSLCTEARGLQELWSKTRPELIRQLKESAVIQSAESSNRIEGVEVDKIRLKPLLLGQTKPRTRSEEEVLGYRKALDFIHSNSIEICPKSILKLHKIAQGGLINDAGKWKTKDNQIIEFSKHGDRKIRFECTSAKETPKAIEKLCANYNELINSQKFPDLIIIASFVLDFLCIHPFRDGNGRVSRLLTLLCLNNCNYQVGKFISLERLTEESKSDYYEALGKSSQGWHKDQHDSYYWWAFFLSILRNAYQELKENVDLTQTSNTRSSIIRQIVLNMSSEFQISDILRLQPSLDREIVKKVLRKMKAEKIIKSLGSGRASRWKLLK